MKWLIIRWLLSRLIWFGFVGLFSGSLGGLLAYILFYLCDFKGDIKLLLTYITLSAGMLGVFLDAIFGFSAFLQKSFWIREEREARFFYQTRYLDCHSALAKYYRAVAELGRTPPFLGALFSSDTLANSSIEDLLKARLWVIGKVLPGINRRLLPYGTYDLEDWFPIVDDLVALYYESKPKNTLLERVRVVIEGDRGKELATYIASEYEKKLLPSRSGKKAAKP